MIKKIIIYSIIYAILLITIIFTLSEMENVFILAIVVLGLVFGVLIIFEVYKKYIAGSKPEKYDLQYTNTDIENLNKISSKPFLFGSGKENNFGS